MQRTVSAALLSALVFPGAGHLYLRRPLRGCVFLVPALVALAWFTVDVVRQAAVLSDQVLAGTLAPDPAAIAARLQTQGGSTLAGTLCAVVLLACWAGAIADSIVIARQAAKRPE
ncbi:DUF6677 family protein [Massilia horti]|uniref:TM2 domain-containing protein n=1 Tax=Massilia horti TaxID=2562153 RepID=A0A4Y9T1Y9_9BURK|nr:DUF6677 family protein [Massilia horti]TFW33010.1 hypothetical protein E4O92_08805 [Massilia horti]